MLTEPRPHQLKALKYGIKNPYSILALQQGTGKTALALYIRDRLKIKKTLIICPSYLIPTWKEEILKHNGHVNFVSFFDKGSKIYYPFDSSIVVTSYELGQKAEFLFDWANYVAFDEAHELKTMNTKRTEFYHRVVFENSVKRVHFFTGTPLKNGVYEYYSLLALCNYNPRLKNPPFLRQYPDAIKFADRFSYRQQYTLQIGNKRVQVLKWKGLRKKRIPELNKIKENIYLRILASEVFTTEPITYKDILVSEIPDMKLLKAFNDYYENSDNAGTDPTAKSLSAENKTPFCVKYVKGIIDEVGSIAIYTDHVPSCKKLAEAFGVEPITGEISVKRRHAIAAKWKRGETNVLVATYKSYSQGVDLTRANNLILNDYPWVPGDIEQAEFRINRMNQKRTVWFTEFFGSPQDKYIFETVMDKKKNIDQVT